VEHRFLGNAGDVGTSGARCCCDRRRGPERGGRTDPAGDGNGAMRSGRPPQMGAAWRSSTPGQRSSAPAAPRRRSSSGGAGTPPDPARHRHHIFSSMDRARLHSPHENLTTRASCKLTMTSRWKSGQRRYQDTFVAARRRLGRPERRSAGSSPLWEGATHRSAA